MRLRTSNYYKKELQIDNEKYFNLINSGEFYKAFMSYKDEQGDVYYAFSLISIAETFVSLVDVILDIPDELLFVSEYHPFHLLEKGQHPTNFRKIEPNFVEQLKRDTEDYHFNTNFYIKKEDFRPSFVKLVNTN